MLEQFLKVPNGKHDDVVDWLAWIGIGLDGISHMDTKIVAPVRAYKPGSGSWVIAQGRAESKILAFKKRVAGW